MPSLYFQNLSPLKYFHLCFLLIKHLTLCDLIFQTADLIMNKFFYTLFVPLNISPFYQSF